MPIERRIFPPKDFPIAVHVKSASTDTRFRAMVDSPFTQILREVLTPSPDYPDQSLWIPYDMAEREQKFKKAFEELKPYMDHIRKYPIE